MTHTAIYARTAPDAPNAVLVQLVTRCAFAAAQGCPVAADYVFADEGASGATLFAPTPFAARQHPLRTWSWHTPCKQCTAGEESVWG